MSICQTSPSASRQSMCHSTQASSVWRRLRNVMPSTPGRSASRATAAKLSVSRSGEEYTWKSTSRCFMSSPMRSEPTRWASAPTARQAPVMSSCRTRAHARRWRLAESSRKDVVMSVMLGEKARVIHIYHSTSTAAGKTRRGSKKVAQLFTMAASVGRTRPRNTRRPLTVTVTSRLRSTSASFR